MVNNSNGIFINSNALSLPSNLCTIHGTKIQFEDFIELSDVSLVTVEMTSRVWLICSGNRYTTVRSISHDCVICSRSLFLTIRKCKMLPHAIAGGAHDWRTSISSHRVCHDIYKSTVAHTAEKRKRKNFFANRTTRQCTTHFSLPHYRCRTNR